MLIIDISEYDIYLEAGIKNIAEIINDNSRKIPNADEVNFYILRIIQNAL